MEAAFGEVGHPTVFLGEVSLPMHVSLQKRSGETLLRSRTHSLVPSPVSTSHILV